MARERLTYVSPESDAARAFGILGSVTNTAGDMVQDVYSSKYIQQAEADSNKVQVAANQLLETKKSELFADGNYDKFAERIGSAWDGLSDELKEMTGLGSAVDQWMRNHGDQFKESGNYTLNKYSDMSIEALNTTSTESAMELAANTPGTDMEGVFLAGSDVYKQDLHSNDENNPRNPNMAFKYVNTVFSTNARSQAESAVSTPIVTVGDDGTEYTRYETEDEFVKRGLAGLWDPMKSQILKNVPEGYFDNPSHMTREQIEITFDGQTPTAEQILREAYRSAWEEKATQLTQKTKTLDNQMALDAAKGMAHKPEEVLLAYENMGLDLSSPIVIEHLASTYPQVKKYWQDEQDETTARLNSYISSDRNEIYTMAAKGGQFYTADSYAVYSKDGVSTIESDGIVNADTEVFLNDSFLSLKGEEGARISTQYGGIVEALADKYEITDPIEKMRLASMINEQFAQVPATGTGGSGSSGGTSVPEDMPNAAEQEIWKMIYDISNVENDAILDKLNFYAQHGLIDANGYQKLSGEIDKRKTPTTAKTEKALKILQEQLDLKGLDEGEEKKFKAVLGWDSTLEAHIRDWCTNHPNATDNDIRDYARSVTGEYQTAKSAKDIDRVTKKLYSEVLGFDYYDISSNESVRQTMNRYYDGEDIFALDNAEQIGLLKESINTGNFDSVDDVRDFAANLFFGGVGRDVKYEDLDDHQKACVGDGIVIAFAEVNQYQRVKDVAEAVAGKDYRQVRMDDGSIGIMDKSGNMYTSLGSKTALQIGKIDTDSAEYKEIFGTLYNEYGVYNAGSQVVISRDRVKNWTIYTPTFFKDSTYHAYNSIPRDEWEARAKAEGLSVPQWLQKMDMDGRSMGEYIEDAKKGTVGLKQIKKDKDITVDDYRNDWKLKSIITGNIGARGEIY